MAAAPSAAPRLRPLEIGEILDVAIKVCVKHYRTLLCAVAVVVVPVQIVSALVLASTVGADSVFFQPEIAPDDPRIEDELPEFLGGLAVTLLLTIVGTALAAGACLRAIAESYLGAETDWRSSLRFAVRRLPALLWVTIISYVAWILGAIVLIAPGVWLFVAFAFAMPVVLAEDIRGFRALGRSFGLVWMRWWRTFGVLLVGFLLALVVSAVLQGVFFLPIIFSLDNMLLFFTLSALSGIAGALVATPFQAAVLAVTYFDLRVRKEGFDLELLADEIGARAPAGAAGAVTADAAPSGDDPQPAPWPAPDAWSSGRNGSDDPPPRLPGVPGG